MDFSVEQKIIIVELAYKIFGSKQAALLWHKFEFPGVNQPCPITATEQKDIESVQNFLSECILTDPVGVIQARTLYEAYGAWCKENTLRPLSEKAFAIKLENIGVLKRKGRINQYLNIRLATKATDSQDVP